MRVLVTGAAGFIGTHTAGALLDRGDEVVGVDCLSSYYASEIKEANLAALKDKPGFDFRRFDLVETPLEAILDEVDAVIHLSAQPGVRPSWDRFGTYVRDNIEATQRLLEATRVVPPARFVYASSSSIYGATDGHASSEDDRPRPHSPYGVTKLAAEQLCSAYAQNWKLPTISLRYFTVYGSRQRPDMLIHRVIVAALEGKQLPLYGGGSQVRDFTHVSDVVAANLAALDTDVAPGTICNIGGGTSVSVRDVIERVEQVLGEEIALDRKGDAPGDVSMIHGSIDRARMLLGWEPRTAFAEGLAEQIEWHRSRQPARIGHS